MTSFHKKIYLTSGAFALGIILVISLIIFPLVQKIGADSQELFQKEKVVESFLQNWQDLENSKKDYAEIKKELEEKPALLVPQEAIKFIQAMESFAQATQNYQTISVLKKTPSAEAEADVSPENILDFQISLWGSFPNLIKFLIYLENAPYLTNVASLQINRLTEKEFSQLEEINLPAGNINSVITLLVYQQDEASSK